MNAPDETSPMQQPRVAVSPGRRHVEHGRRWLRRGAILLAGGTGPLFLIIALAKLGIGDPNPNPIGPGLLAALTFWPSIGMILYGAVQMARGKSG